MFRPIRIRAGSAIFCPYKTPLLIREQYAITDARSMSCDGGTMYHGFLCGSA